MVIEQGEKLHLMVRRNFETDLRRHYVGEVTEASGSIARIEGYAFVLDTATNRYIKKRDKRVRIVALSDAGNIINILPADADLEAVKYQHSEDARLIVTDGKTFTLDINEFGVNQ